MTVSVSECNAIVHLKLCGLVRSGVAAPNALPAFPYLRCLRTSATVPTKYMILRWGPNRKIRMLQDGIDPFASANKRKAKSGSSHCRGLWWAMTGSTRLRRQTNEKQKAVRRIVGIVVDDDGSDPFATANKRKAKSDSSHCRGLWWAMTGSTRLRRQTNEKQKAVRRIVRDCGGR